MFVRMLASLAVVAALTVAAPASPGSSGPRGSVTSSFKLEYRKAGTSVWALKGTFPSDEAARAEASRLFNAGYDVRLTKAETITWLRTQTGDTGRVTPGPVTGETAGGISVVNYAKALEVFKAVAARTDIAFRYVPDGCYARAHLMGLQMQALGLKPGKAWSFADDAFFRKIKDAPPLVARSGNHPKGFVVWGYHVAPALKVRKQDGSVLVAVIDPSLAEKPVSLSAWQKLMMYDPASKTIRASGFKPRMDVTKWGQAPTDHTGRRLPGNGYSPAGSTGDPTRAARDTMALYKPLQGTDRMPPRPVFASREARFEVAMAFVPAPQVEPDRTAASE